MFNPFKRKPAGSAAESQARQLRAEMELAQLKLLKSQFDKAVEGFAGLNIHQAADQGRRNADWRGNSGSADLANITDSTILLGRARSQARDSWIISSIRRSFRRNVAGAHGITITPHAKDKNGKPLAAFNQRVLREFTRWAESKLGDVERKCTFAQQQRRAVSEKTLVGEHLWVWSYDTPARPNASPVGLKLQAFEPEQFDMRLVSYGPNEVRGGVEVDSNGAPVAYHLYTRNPNDLLYRYGFYSQRVPANRCFHYFEVNRTLQSRASLPAAPIMQDVRDLSRIREATLWRTFLEACIGFIIRQPVSSATNGPGNLLAPAPGAPTTTNSGMSTADVVPGMIPRLLPGEDVTPFTPQSPGNTYDPFTQLTVRGIGAGMGLSFGQVMRHNDGSYSAARQDGNDDWNEFNCEHDDLISDMIRPTYELFVHLAVLEGRFDDLSDFDRDDFHAESWRYVQAEYIPQPKTQIDPEKEANAFAVLLKHRLITREEIIALRGDRIWNVAAKMAAENTQLEGQGLSLPENADEKAGLRELVKQMLTNPLTATQAMNSIMQILMLNRAVVPANPAFKQEPIEPPAAPASPTPSAPETSTNVKTAAKDSLPQEKNPHGLDAYQSLRLTPVNVPAYRDAADPVQSCATCSFARDNYCTRFNFITAPEKICHDWSANTLTESIDKNGGPGPAARNLAPLPQPGQAQIERRFYPANRDGAQLPDQAGA